MERDDFTKASELYELQKYSEAFDIFHRLALSGHVYSMTRVALMYSMGEGTNQNVEKSLYWDRKAAGLGDETALFNLALTEKAQGNIAEAERHLEKCLAHGDAEAGIELIKIRLQSSTLPTELAEIARATDRNIGEATEGAYEEWSLVKLFFGW